MSLRAEKLSFSYPNCQQVVLQNFSTQFNQKEIVAISGPNGCGKTTLSKLLVGILQPSSGCVYLDEVNLVGLSLATIGKKIGYVMQNPMQQLFCTSVEAEVEYGLKNLQLAEAEISKRVDFYLAYFQLTALRQSFPFALSQGEKQRLVLAAILAMQPKYLLLDEPTAALDVFRKRLLGEELQKICVQLGCGIIIISHDEKFVAKYAHRQMTMGVASELF